MRLIDADVLREKVMQKYDYVEEYLEDIDSQPTAYDVDKVVEELDDKTKFACSGEYCEDDCDKCDACIIPYHNATDIVTRGGVK